MPRSTFPTDHADVPTEVLLNVYEQAPSRVAQVLVGLDDDGIWHRARGPRRWSIGEIICHLADSETVAAVRIRTVRCQSGAPLIAYDPDRYAAELQYAARKREPDASFRVFAALRATTSQLMRSWEPEIWQRAGEHPEWGRVTLRQLLELYADHGERHLDQILENRTRQLRPAALPSILSGRFGESVAVPVEPGVGGMP